MDLAELISGLDAPRYLRLCRHLIDDAPFDRRTDHYGIPALAHGLKGAELFVKKVAKVSSMESYLSAWAFQFAYLPALNLTTDAVERFLLESLRQALSALAERPDASSILNGSYVPDPEEWGDPSSVDYYLMTNLMADIAQPGVTELVAQAQAMFAQFLPDLEIPRFGIGTPETLSLSARAKIEEYVRDVFWQPTGYQVVSRHGRLSVSPFRDHGTFVNPGSSIAGGTASVATAVSTLDIAMSTSPVLDEFEALINDSRAREADFQSFLKAHDVFFRSLGYCEARPHVCLSDTAQSNLIPDFLVRLDGQEVWDLVELKLPAHPIFSRKEEASPSAATARGITQLLGYRDYFASTANRDRLAREFGTAPFEPSLVLVIGREAIPRCYRWRSDRIGMPDARVVSYDYMLERARSQLVAISDQRSVTQEAKE